MVFGGVVIAMGNFESQPEEEPPSSVPKKKQEKNKDSSSNSLGSPWLIQILCIVEVVVILVHFFVFVKSKISLR